MTAQVRQRVARVCDELIQKHLDLLILLQAEQGADPEVQRQRTDVLVRCLGAAQIEDTIFQNGRRIPATLDAEVDPPALKLNAELLERVEDEQIFGALVRPISTLLELPPINVGLVLQGRDEKQLRNLYHSGQRKLEHPVVRATTIRAVIERRVTTFAARLRDLIATLSDQEEPIELLSPQPLIGWLEERGGTWPEWIDVEERPFIATTVKAAKSALSDSEDLPPGETLAELCWESLNLSPQTYLRTASRSLRTQELPMTERLLRAVAEVVAPGRVAEIEHLEQWPSLRELQESWRDLVSLEHQVLDTLLHGDRTIPEISVLQAPRDSMGLREPEGLPWDAPLAAWSVRETSALRDLLQGFIQAQRSASGADEESEPELLLIETPEEGQEPLLDVSGDPQRVDLQVVNATLEMPPGYDVMSARAMESVLKRLEEQMRSMGDSGYLSILNRIRGSYDGFFMGTRHVWQRRLQGWKLDPPVEALRRLTGAVSEILNCPVIFDPFEGPNTDRIRPMPTFCFVVATSPHLDKVPFRVPISALNMTAATGTPPLRVRVVEVPGSPDEPCRWICDQELTMDTMQGQPVQATLKAIERDMLRMIATK